MFKKFVKEICETEGRDALLDIFYRIDGVDMMFQRRKLSWDEHQMLLGLIVRLSKE